MKKLILKNICCDSIEEYYFIYDENKKDILGYQLEESQAEIFLSEICYCDAYEIISIEEADEKAKAKYNNAISELKKLGIEVTDILINACLLYVKGYYETIEEIIKDYL